MRAAGVLVLRCGCTSYAPAPLSRRPRAVSLNVATEDPATTVADDEAGEEKQPPGRAGASRRRKVPSYRPSSKRTARARPPSRAGPRPRRRRGAARARGGAGAARRERPTPSTRPRASPRHAIAATRSKTTQVLTDARDMVQVFEDFEADEASVVQDDGEASQSPFGYATDAVTGALFDLLHFGDASGIEDSSKNLSVVGPSALR